MVITLDNRPLNDPRGRVYPKTKKRHVHEFIFTRETDMYTWFKCLHCRDEHLIGAKRIGIYFLNGDYKNVSHTFLNLEK